MARLLAWSSRGGERRTPLGAAAALALALAALAGCGGERDEGGRAVTLPAGRSVEVVGDEFSFDPETVRVEPGTGGGRVRVELQLRNQGALAHNLKVFEGNREIGGTPTFAGGAVRSATVSLRPGSYRFVCTVGDHAERGMVGRLTIR